ncbi:MAG TPA: patatin-like phospholipase family protein [Rubrivivax sp.]|nr:patatin-like phospholipase family protein [Rubrivivax sp.]
MLRRNMRLWPTSTGTISLALQGGGAHGAFTWGVLDALLERAPLSIAAVSGASAGAVNAVLLAHGLVHGGPDAARAALHRFWTAIGASVPWDLLGWLAVGGEQLNTTGRLMLQWLNAFSPDTSNPLGLDPLRDLLIEQVDFDALRRQRQVALHIAATRVDNGRLRIFGSPEVSLDAVLASACLPSLRRSVTIDGVAYWDGGYSANPPLFSLLRARRSDDVLIVMLSPWSFGGEPKGAEQIRTRALEIAFNAAFLCEARLIAQATRLAQQALWPGPLERALRAMRWHLIDGHDTLSALPTDSKLITHPQLLTRLHDAGRERALDWLARGGKAVGARSSVDLRSLFGGGVPRGMGGDALAEVASGR